MLPFLVHGSMKEASNAEELHNIEQFYTVHVRAVLNKCSRNAIYTQNN